MIETTQTSEHEHHLHMKQDMQVAARVAMIETTQTSEHEHHLHMEQNMQVAALNVDWLGQSYMKVTDLCKQFSAYRLDTLHSRNSPHGEICSIHKHAGTKIRRPGLFCLKVCHCWEFLSLKNVFIPKIFI
jgi:hypothetical protein